LTYCGVAVSAGSAVEGCSPAVEGASSAGVAGVSDVAADGVGLSIVRVGPAFCAVAVTGGFAG